ncbi:spore coat protein CotH [Petralouisia muris]|uniref:Spore coat protein CotH n=1 Tax=Petralouisia muris TaxID=3032872 RepID=A0AC61S237_9FIRM|nr:CotH kinase family protein [Petralouisia muris]TGY98357.1 spore coat protein CotH [Petralouisia muris]
MSTHKHFDKICCVVLAVSLLLTVLFMNAESFGVPKASAVMGYEKKLFDASTVHTIDIVMDDWDEFLANCKSEEYYTCSVVIDNDAYKNVAIRGKGNTSLTQVESYGNDRYSFKLEFDHYDSTNTYYGLDKLCLNNIIQDNTYMKDYLSYQMMADMGVASPLCSYVYLRVNGEDWGLYLAVEGIEESFLQRNYGNDYGQLYKPDSQNMGGQTPGGDAPNTGGQTPGKGGRGNGSEDVLLKYIDDEIDSYENIFKNAKTDSSDSEKERLIAALKKLNSGEDLANTVDIEKVIRYFVVHNFVLNFDSYTGSMIHNYYLYEKDGQMQMIPWDYNIAFGGFESAGGASNLVNYPIDSPVSGGNVEDRPMISWIFADEEYTELYHQYFAEFISEYFDSDYFTEMMDNVSSMIAPFVEKDPTKFCTYEEFEKGVSTLKEFCLLRAESITGQLNGTIGLTSDTQKSDTLVDAGDLQITDMGSMNHAMGGRGMEQPVSNMGGDRKLPQGEVSNGETPELPRNNEEGDANGQMQNSGENGMPSENSMPGEMGQMGESGHTTANLAVSWTWAGISAGVLVLGIVAAALFKRRKIGS